MATAAGGQIAGEKPAPPSTTQERTSHHPEAGRTDSRSTGLLDHQKASVVSPTTRRCHVVRDNPRPPETRSRETRVLPQRG